MSYSFRNFRKYFHSKITTYTVIDALIVHPLVLYTYGYVVRRLVIQPSTKNNKNCG